MKRNAVVILLTTTLAALLVVLPSHSAGAAPCKPALSKVTLSKASVEEGKTLRATVSLTCKATKATTVKLAAVNGVTVPKSVRIAKAKKSAAFTVRASATDVERTATVKATLGKVKRSDTVKVVPTADPDPCDPAITSVDIPVLYAGDELSASATLACAPETDVQVALSSDTASLIVPNKVAVSAGETHVSIPVTAQMVEGDQYIATVDVSYGGTVVSEPVTVNPGVASVETQTNTDSTTLGVATNLTGDAPDGGITVSMWTDNPAVVIVPATVKIPEFASGRVILAEVADVAEPTTVTIFVKLGTRTVSTTKVITPQP